MFSMDLAMESVNQAYYSGLGQGCGILSFIRWLSSLILGILGTFTFRHFFEQVVIGFRFDADYRG